MQMLLADILGNLGIALFHSVWQGAIAFLAVVGIRALTRERDSALRYIAQVFILFACFAAFLSTFAAYQFSAAPGAATSLLETTTAATGIVLESTPGASAFAFDQIFARYAPWLGVFWCIGFVVLSLRYASDYRFTQKLRHQGLSDVPAIWQNRFEALARRSGLARYTGFFVSERVTGPVTLGTFKPIVLVPIGFFTSLPADQIEAILLHEIAHIRRNDYFINLLQTAIKTVFFYHPAITYICRKIDEDREYACDDYAVDHTKNPAALAKGLAAIRLSVPNASFAMAANGKDTPLLARMKRIAGHRVNRRGHGPFASTLAALTLGIAVLATVTISTPAEASPDGYGHDDVKTNYRFETVEKFGQTVTAKVARDGTRWIRIKDDWHDLDRSNDAKMHLQDLAGGPDGNKLTPPTPPTPPSAPDLSHMSHAGAGASEDEFERVMAQFEIDMEYFEAAMEQFADELEEFHDNDAARAHTVAKAHAEARQLEVSARKIEREVERQIEHQEHHAERLERKAERMAEKAERERERAHERATERAREAHERATERAHEAHQRHADKEHADLDDFQSGLTNQLIEDGLIKPGTSLIKIEMSGDDMKVNGTPIPETIRNNYCNIMSNAGIHKSHQTKITIANNGESISIHSHN